MRQAFADRRGRPLLVLIETLPGSAWDVVPPSRPARVIGPGGALQAWPARGGRPAVVRVESQGTAALVSSATLPLVVLERVAAGLR